MNAIFTLIVCRDCVTEANVRETVLKLTKSAVWDTVKMTTNATLVTATPIRAAWLHLYPEKSLVVVIALPTETAFRDIVKTTLAKKILRLWERLETAERV